MDDLQEAKRYLKIVAKSQAKAERQRAKERRQRAKDRAEDKRKQAVADKERAELRKQSKLTDEQLRRTDEQLRRTEVLVGHLSNRFGDIAEAMLVGDVAETLQTIGNLRLEHSFFSAKNLNGDNTVECEIDALLVGRDSIVVMEAKSMLTTSKIKKFINSRLKKFTELFPDFANKNVYGAVGYLKAEDDAVKLAIKEGLLVVRSTLQAKEVINSEDFKPRDYNPHH